MIPLPEQTDRLQFRAVTLEDADFFLEVMNDPAFLAFIGDRGVKNRTEAIAYIQTKVLPAYQAHGYGTYLVLEKESGEILGYCGIFERPGFDCPDFGYAYLERARGKGYALEAGVSLARFAFEVLKLPRVTAIVDPGNERSARLLEKLCFKKTHQQCFPGTDYLIDMFERTAKS